MIGVTLLAVPLGFFGWQAKMGRSREDRGYGGGNHCNRTFGQ